MSYVGLPSTCSTPGCGGDVRYAAPGRGHVSGCHYPLDAPIDETTRPVLADTIAKADINCVGAILLAGAMSS